MDTDIFIVHIKTENIYVDIAKDVETRFDTSKYVLEKLLPKVKKSNCHWINEWWTRWKNNDIIWCVEGKKILLFSRWWWLK